MGCLDSRISYEQVIYLQGIMHGNMIYKSELELYLTNNKILEFITSCHASEGFVLTYNAPPMYVLKTKFCILLKQLNL